MESLAAELALLRRRPAPVVSFTFGCPEAATVWALERPAHGVTVAETMAAITGDRALAERAVAAREHPGPRGREGLERFCGRGETGCSVAAPGLADQGLEQVGELGAFGGVGGTEGGTDATGLRCADMGMILTAGGPVGGQTRPPVGACERSGHDVSRPGGALRRPRRRRRTPLDMGRWGRPRS